jgi:hypothetical protein
VGQWDDGAARAALRAPLERLPVTNPKGSGAHSPVMKATPRRSPADRDRAISRLRSITVGTTIASVAAVGAFGAVAAMSYTGTSADVTTAAVTTTTSTGAGTSNSSTTTSTSTSSSTSLQATAAPTTTTTTTSGAHATSGGS